MKQLSIDNGNTRFNDSDHLLAAMQQVGIETIISYMDQDIYRGLYDKPRRQTPLSLIGAYLRKAKQDLIIG
jgi:hypothetical protein